MEATVDDLRPEELRLLNQLEELKERLAELAHENADLRVQRDLARAQVVALLPKATPEQEEEFRQQLAGEWVDGSAFIADLVADVEKRHGRQ